MRNVIFFFLIVFFAAIIGFCWDFVALSFDFPTWLRRASCIFLIYVGVGYLYGNQRLKHWRSHQFDKMNDD